MTYTLFLWITGCVGLSCPIPDYEEQTFVSEVECNKALTAAMSIAKKTQRKYAGICIPEDMYERLQERKNNEN